MKNIGDEKCVLAPCFITLSPGEPLTRYPYYPAAKD